MNDIWTQVKTAIKGHIPEHSYRMWIEPVSFKGQKQNTLILNCPNIFSKKRILNHYGQLIEAEIQKIWGDVSKLVVEVNGTQKQPPKKRAAKSASLRPDPQLTLPGVASHQPYGRLLKQEFTFDRFIVGNNNTFAYSAALSVASQRDISQKSLFLLSQTGMGKSHLSQAVGHHILSHCPGERVYYVTAEEFTNEMVRAFRSKTFEKFKEKYRHQCDVLLLEDVHFLTGKDRTQMELALALDYLLNADKRIIFTSCYLPGDIPKINDQLRSRLSGGLISNIEAPNFQTRFKILQQKMRESGYKLPRPIAEYLASELSENVRQLESGLIGVTAKSSLLGSPIDLCLAESVVKNITASAKNITVDSIKDLVSRHYDISVEEMVSKSRKKGIVRPRQMAIYLARKYTDQPLQTIGRSFNRYHTTVIYSIAAVEKNLHSDMALKKQLEILCHKMES